MPNTLKLGALWLVTLWVGCGQNSVQPITNSAPVAGEQESIEQVRVEAAPGATGVSEHESTQPTTAATAADTQTDVFPGEVLKYGVVRIDLLQGGPIGYGTVVSRSTTGFDVVTADHLVQNHQSFAIQAWSEDGQRFEAWSNATVMHRDSAIDLAYLRVRALDAPVKPLSFAVVPESTKLSQAWTYHDESRRAVFECREVSGRVLAKRSRGDTAVSYWQLAGKITPGMSGGPLITARGDWIGVASGNSQGHAYYVDDVELKKFLELIGLRSGLPQAVP